MSADFTGGNIMSKIEWDDFYSVHIPKIDEQHKGLVGMISELQVAMSNGAAKDVLGKVLDNLIDYTIVHFNTEEELLRTNNYPEFDKHKLEHERLTGRVQEFKSKFSNGGIATTFELMEFLSDWLIQHIVESDKQYSKFINK
jgi:hemerythrin